MSNVRVKHFVPGKGHTGYELDVVEKRVNNFLSMLIGEVVSINTQFIKNDDTGHHYMTTVVYKIDDLLRETHKPTMHSPIREEHS